MVRRSWRLSLAGRDKKRLGSHHCANSANRPGAVAGEPARPLPEASELIPGWAAFAIPKAQELAAIDSGCAVVHAVGWPFRSGRGGYYAMYGARVNGKLGLRSEGTPEALVLRQRGDSVLAVPRSYMWGGVWANTAFFVGLLIILRLAIHQGRVRLGNQRLRRGECPACGYCAKSGASTCPECGAALGVIAARF